MRDLRFLLPTVVLPLALLLAFASNDYGVLVRALPSPDKSTKSNDQDYDLLLRDLGESSGDSSDNGSSFKCNKGCSNNNDCDTGFVCYRRKSNENLPRCCDDLGFDKRQGDNYCVSAGCAAYTPTDRTDHDPPHWVLYDDDTFLKDLDKLYGICQGDCSDDHDCRPGLICWKDTTPACCEKQTFTNIEGVKSFCAAESFNRANEPVDLCFSGVTRLQVLGEAGDKMMKSMAELEVGDRVLSSTSEQSYQTVYAFAHLHETRPTKFLQFFTDSTSSEAAFEVTENHLLYTEGKPYPVPAKTVRVGDLLHVMDNVQDHSTLNVTSIESILRMGVYAPLTRDGTVVVGEDNIVASNYVTVQRSAKRVDHKGHVEMKNIGTISWLHQADVTHMWLSPLRLVCTLEQQIQPNTTFLRWMLPSSICTSRNAEDGLLHYVAAGLKLTHFMEEQPLWAQLAVLIPVLFLFSICTALENLILEKNANSSLLAALAFLVCYKYRQRMQQKV